MRQELATGAADDAAAETNRLRDCLACKESELEIMQGWLSKGDQATKVSIQPWRVELLTSITPSDA